MPSPIIVVGLGPGDPDQISLGIWRKLQQASRTYLRTERHPLVSWLRENGIRFDTFDAVYEKHGAFGPVYEEIADILIREAKNGANFETPVLYAVPGHPAVAERTVQLLRERCPSEGIPLEIMGGESFLDRAFLSLNIDPIDGFQLLDATVMTGFANAAGLSDEERQSSLPLYRGAIDPTHHVIIGQVYDTNVASDVKLTLMEIYPHDYTVVVAHSLGVQGEESITGVPLYELDRQHGYGNLSLIYVPPSKIDEHRNRSFDRLHEIVSILRSPTGCPWDREQTHATIRKNFIEETYEVLETIDDDDPDAMCEELGDVMLQIMLHAQMEEETGAFSVYDVIQSINEKLIRRHPHVFGDRAANNAADALANWNEIKKQEKASKGIDTETLSVLAGVPRDLPALMKAYKLQQKAAKVGFDWDRIEEVIGKVREELSELEEAMGQKDARATAEELGDVLFSIVNLARFLKTDPEEALSATNQKFTQRFRYIEDQLRLNGRSFDQTSLTEMEDWWQEAKKRNSSMKN